MIYPLTWWRIAAAQALMSVSSDASLDSLEAEQVCQGRQFAGGYSSCADLAHWLYATLGLQHKQLNRAPTWVCGVNVSRLAGWYEARRAHTDLRPLSADILCDVAAGDVLIRWSREDSRDAHVVCVIDALGAGAVRTAEYGQAKPVIGRQYTRQLSGEGRPIRVWLPLPLVLTSCGVVFDAEDTTGTP